MRADENLVVQGRHLMLAARERTEAPVAGWYDPAERRRPSIPITRASIVGIVRGIEGVRAAKREAVEEVGDSPEIAVDASL